MSNDYENRKKSVVSDWLFWGISGFLFFGGVSRGGDFDLWAPLITAILFGYFFTRVIRAFQDNRKNR